MRPKDNGMESFDLIKYEHIKSVLSGVIRGSILAAILAKKKSYELSLLIRE
jgi:hypothetical protein